MCHFVCHFMHPKFTFVGKYKTNFMNLQFYLLLDCLHFILSVWKRKQKVRGILKIEMGQIQIPSATILKCRATNRNVLLHMLRIVRLPI